MINGLIAKLIDGHSLSEDESYGAMTHIMRGDTSNSQIASYLTALRCKGESVSELVGSVKCMREHSIKVKLDGASAVDLCGTGGDGKHTFNISTTCAFVVAGAGVKVAKHGNRAASSNCGSADLFEELGVRIDLDSQQVARCIEEIGLGFIFAPLFHPAMKNVAPVRRELGIRTIFNILGPLANPAEIDMQLIGVFKKDLIGDIAHTLRGLGTKSAVVVHGGGGYDEATTVDINEIAVLRNGEVSTRTLAPEELGFSAAKPEDLEGGTPKENAQITLKILQGEKSPRTDAVLLNSCLALYVSGKAGSLDESLEMAKDSIESGSALEVLDKLVKTSQKMKK